jgi:hypothetical protein
MKLTLNRINRITIQSKRFDSRIKGVDKKTDVCATKLNHVEKKFQIAKMRHALILRQMQIVEKKRNSYDEKRGILNTNLRKLKEKRSSFESAKSSLEEKRIVLMGTLSTIADGDLPGTCIPGSRRRKIEHRDSHIPRKKQRRKSDLDPCHSSTANVTPPTDLTSSSADDSGWSNSDSESNDAPKSICNKTSSGSADSPATTSGFDSVREECTLPVDAQPRQPLPHDAQTPADSTLTRDDSLSSSNSDDDDSDGISTSSCDQLPSTSADSLVDTGGLVLSRSLHQLNTSPTSQPACTPPASPSYMTLLTSDDIKAAVGNGASDCGEETYSISEALDFLDEMSKVDVSGSEQYTEPRPITESKDDTGNNSVINPEMMQVCT